MRFVAVDGRASLVRGDAVFDVAECSGGAIPADPMLVLPDPRRLPLGRAYVIAEPELAVVTRAAGRTLSLDAARSAIAGYAVAQDITERVHEFGPSPSPWTWENLPAKTLGKSIDTFCPLGPALVTPDEVTAAGDLEKRC
jgi:2-keto-4-pentenoate hydratase/2-oxohepta-3-ene-1,7-dioic acid hydratase in catechol pathway